MIEVKDYGYCYNVIFNGDKDDYHKFFNFMMSKEDIIKLKKKTG